MSSMSDSQVNCRISSATNNLMNLNSCRLFDLYDVLIGCVLEFLPLRDVATFSQTCTTYCDSLFCEIQKKELYPRKLENVEERKKESKSYVSFLLRVFYKLSRNEVERRIEANCIATFTLQFPLNLYLKTCSVYSSKAICRYAVRKMLSLAASEWEEYKNYDDHYELINLVSCFDELKPLTRDSPSLFTEVVNFYNNRDYAKEWMQWIGDTFQAMRRDECREEWAKKLALK